MPHRKAKLELYNLATDPSEENNLAPQRADKVKELKAKVTEIVVRGRTTPGVRQKNDTGYWRDLTWLTPDQFEALSAQTN